jgi:two-component system, NarL family, nitrate/nitrite response regulator NarL
MTLDLGGVTMTGTAITVVLADDHPIYREGLARTLGEPRESPWSARPPTGPRRAAGRGPFAPDLVLLDISMPKGGGMAALAQIRALPAPPHVAMLTASETQDDLMQAMRHGALGYILKGVGAGELVIWSVTLRAASPTWPRAGGATSGLACAAKPHPAIRCETCRKREEDILRLVAQGKSNREVGEALDLQEKTVKHYMTSILQKLHVRNRVEAAMLAREHLKG